MLNYIKSIIWGSNDSSLTDAYDILNQVAERENPIKAEPDSEDNIKDYEAENKTGEITNLRNCTYEIDNKYYFESEEFFTIGMKISFTLFKELGRCKIANVKEIVDEWDKDMNDTVKQWCTRHIVAEVMKRNGHNLFIEPGGIQLNLNEVASEFIPIVGDFVELETKSEINESVVNLNGKILEIIKIRPVRARILEGRIKSFNEKTYNGIINKDIFFNKDALVNGYIPKAEDKIVTEIIESNQGTCYWRSLKIVLQSLADKSSSNPFGALPKLATYQHSAKGIKVTDNVVINANKFNESQTFEMEITNEKCEDIILKSIGFESQLGQVKLTSPKFVNKITISAGCTLKFVFTSVIRSMGKSKEIILFHFDDITIGRIVYLILNSTNPKSDNGTLNGNSQSRDFFKKMHSLNKAPANNFFRGEPIRAGARFTYKKVNDWAIPNNFSNLYYKYDDKFSFKENFETEVVRIKPCLNETLSLKNYDDRFHALLFMEELHYNISMRIYDHERVCFIRDPTFLILEIENLAETRPSIIIGDKIFATCLETSDVFEGFVHRVSGSHIFLKFSAVFHQQYKGEDYKIHVVPSRANFRRQHQAIYLAKIRIKDILFPTHILKKSVQVKFTYDPYEDVIIKVTNQNEIAQKEIREPQKISSATESMTKNSRKSRQEIIKLMKSMQVDDSPNVAKTVMQRTPTKKNSVFKLEWFNKELNYYQKEAVRNILLGESRPLPYIIFGPPGTGKTVTLIECILQIVRMIPHARLLIGTPSNSSANLITERLIESGCLKPGDLVRLVSFKSVLDNTIPANIIPYCAIPAVAREGTAPMETFNTENGLIKDMTMNMIGRHKITIGTCGTLGVLQYYNFNKGHFTHILIDEAGQLIEPDIMIPLTNVDLSEGQIIMAGDPMQLGPVVLSSEGNTFGLGETYLDRLINRFPYIRDIVGFPNTGGYDPRLVTKLLYNYRSLPDLLILPNYCFYHNDLRATLSNDEGKEAECLKSISEILPKTASGNIGSLVFHGINGFDQRGDDCPSWYNPDEASQVFFYINELYRLGLKKEDIGIVTPYIKQVRQIRNILSEASFELPKIGTIEDFQGLEFNVILISTVRSNEGMIKADKKHALGFISNPRRFNVALTRSKCLTIVIGSPSLLASDGHWGLLLKQCVENKTYIGCDY